MENKIEIYQSLEGIRVEVNFENDTVWATQKQMAILFDCSTDNISLHLKNIFKTGELNVNEVTEESSATATDGKRYKTKHYNLDIIISLGYRINSQRATQFRKWATQRLKDYLVQGYSINEKRLAEKQMQVETLKTGIRILSRAIETQATQDDGDMLRLFAKGLELLDDYDHEQLDIKGKTLRQSELPTKEEYLELVSSMKSDFFSAVFAQPKDESFESSVAQIGQSFGGQELYPSIEEKAATLLYLIIKNHSFIDGNKRIGAACFLYFLERNGLLFTINKPPIISNDALAALTLFVASSKPEEMETIKKLIVSILNRQ